MITNSAIAKKGARNCRNHEHYVIIRRGKCCRNCVRSSTACCCKHGFFIPQKNYSVAFYIPRGPSHKSSPAQGQFWPKIWSRTAPPRIFSPPGWEPSHTRRYGKIGSLWTDSAQVGTLWVGTLWLPPSSITSQSETCHFSPNQSKVEKNVVSICRHPYKNWRHLKVTRASMHSVLLILPPRHAFFPEYEAEQVWNDHYHSRRPVWVVGWCKWLNYDPMTITIMCYVWVLRYLAKTEFRCKMGVGKYPKTGEKYPKIHFWVRCKLTNTHNHVILLFITSIQVC